MEGQWLRRPPSGDFLLAYFECRPSGTLRPAREALRHSSSGRPKLGLRGPQPRELISNPDEFRNNLLKMVARPERLDSNLGLVVWCSIQLSYGHSQARGCSQTPVPYQPL